MKKVIVVGAGIAGLSAAIYAQRSGFETTLIEQHKIVGGMCTSWRRKGYLFEGAINWLTGANPKTMLNKLWRQTGALHDDVPIVYKDIVSSVEWEGKTLHLYRDIEKTARELARIAPEDEKQLTKLAKHVKALSALEVPISNIKGVKIENPTRMKAGALLKMILAYSKLGPYTKMSALDFTHAFKHPALQMLFSLVPEDSVATSALFTLATFCSGDGGYPQGGSIAMMQRMQKMFTSLGGTLMLNTKVQKVIHEGGCAKGVLLEGQRLHADAVIIATDTAVAPTALFDEPPTDAWLHEMRETLRPSVCTFIGVGVRAAIPHIPLWELDEPILYAGESITHLGFTNYTGHKGYAPEGGVALTTALLGDTYAFWKTAMDEGRYALEKQALAQQIERELCKKFPQAVGQIDVIDIATPLTYERYTSAYHGSWMSIAGIGDKMSLYPGYLKSIQGIYFAGQRIMPPGGMPGALSTGRCAAQMVCRQFGVSFK